MACECNKTNLNLVIHAVHNCFGSHYDKFCCFPSYVVHVPDIQANYVVPELTTREIKIIVDGPYWKMQNKLFLELYAL